MTLSVRPTDPLLPVTESSSQGLKFWNPLNLCRSVSARTQQAVQRQLRSVGGTLAEGASQRFCHIPDPLLTEVYQRASTIQQILAEAMRQKREDATQNENSIIILLENHAHSLVSAIESLSQHERALQQQNLSCFVKPLSPAEWQASIAQLKESANFLTHISPLPAERAKRTLSWWTSQYTICTSAIQQLEKHYDPGLVPDLMNRVQVVTQSTIQGAKETINHASAAAAALPSNMLRSAFGIPQALPQNSNPSVETISRDDDDGYETPSPSPRPLHPRAERSKAENSQISLSLAQVGISLTKSVLHTAQTIGLLAGHNKTVSTILASTDSMLGAQSWDELNAEFQTLFGRFKEDNVPDSEIHSVEDEFNALIRLVSAFPQSTPPIPESEAASRPSEELMKEEKDLFVNNLTAHLTMKNLQKWLGFPLEDEKAVSILKSSRIPGTRIFDPDQFTIHLNQHIAEQNQWIKFKALFLFPLLHTILGHYTRKAVTVYFDKALEQLQEAKKDQFQTLRTSIFREAIRFLTRLNAAYETKESIVTTDEDTRVRNALLIQESKLLQERSGKQYDASKMPKDVISEHLFRPVISSVLKETLGKWKGAIAGWIIKSLIGDPEKFLADLVDTGIQSIQDREGYSAAIGSLTLKQLTQMQETLSLPKYNVTPRQTPQVSFRRTDQLSQFVAQLVEVLDKAQCLTRKELEDSRGQIEIVIKLHKLAISSTIETLALELAQTTNALMNEDELKKVIYQLFESTNNAFIANPLPKEKQEIEQGRAAHAALSKAPTPQSKENHRTEKERTLKIKRILGRIFEDVIYTKMRNSPEQKIETSLRIIRQLSQDFTYAIQDLLEIYSDATLEKAAEQTLFERLENTIQKHLHKCHKSFEAARSHELSEGDRLRVKKHYAHALKQIRDMTGLISSRDQAQLKEISLQVEKPHFPETTLEKVQKEVTHFAYAGAKGKADALFKLCTNPEMLKLGPLYHTLHHLILPPE